MEPAVKTSPDQECVKVFEAAGVVDYLEYLKSGKRIMWVNCKAGAARGLGITLGMTVILGIFIWVLTMLVDLPVVGDYFRQAKQYVTEYADNTNYKDEFQQMNQALREINENTKKAIDLETQQQPAGQDEPVNTPEEQANAQGK
jgi:hypothetical protein